MNMPRVPIGSSDWLGFRHCNIVRICDATDVTKDGCSQWHRVAEEAFKATQTDLLDAAEAKQRIISHNEGPETRISRIDVWREYMLTLKDALNMGNDLRQEVGMFRAKATRPVRGVAIPQDIERVTIVWTRLQQRLDFVWS
jgi:hypothetical protein